MYHNNEGTSYNPFATIETSLSSSKRMVGNVSLSSSLLIAERNTEIDIEIMVHFNDDYKAIIDVKRVNIRNAPPKFSSSLML